MRCMLNNIFSRQSKPVLSFLSMLLSSLGMMLKGETMVSGSGHLSQFKNTSVTFPGERLPLDVISLLKFFNSKLGKTAEMPSANANCSARGTFGWFVKYLK